MSRHDRYLFGLVLARWGFAALVVATIAVGFFAAATVTPPADLPTVALRAEAVYRVEVGGAVFIGLYVATMAFRLPCAIEDSPSSGTAVSGHKVSRRTQMRRSPGDSAMELLADLSEEVEHLEGRLERAQNA